MDLHPFLLTEHSHHATPPAPQCLTLASPARLDTQVQHGNFCEWVPIIDSSSSLNENREGGENDGRFFYGRSASNGVSQTRSATDARANCKSSKQRNSTARNTSSTQETRKAQRRICHSDSTNFQKIKCPSRAEQMGSLDTQVQQNYRSGSHETEQDRVPKATTARRH